MCSSRTGASERKLGLSCGSVGKKRVSIEQRNPLSWFFVYDFYSKEGLKPQLMDERRRWRRSSRRRQMSDSETFRHFALKLARRIVKYACVLNFFTRSFLYQRPPPPPSVKLYTLRLLLDGMVINEQLGERERKSQRVVAQQVGLNIK